MVIISDISVKWRRRSVLSGSSFIFSLGLFWIYKCDNSSHWMLDLTRTPQRTVIQCHLGNKHVVQRSTFFQYSCLYYKYELMKKKLQGLQSSTESHLRQISHFAIHYKKQQIVGWEGNELFCPIFFLLPPGNQIQFSTKSCSEDNKINTGLYPDVDQ